VPSDQRFCSTEAIDVGLLRSLIKDHKASGRRPLIVIAFAGMFVLAQCVSRIKKLFSVILEMLYCSCAVTGQLLLQYTHSENLQQNL